MEDIGIQIYDNSSNANNDNDLNTITQVLDGVPFYITVRNNGETSKDLFINIQTHSDTPDDLMYVPVKSINGGSHDFWLVTQWSDVQFNVSED